MLVENTLFGTRDKVAEAIQRLKSFEPEDGYYVAFSGGKVQDVRSKYCPNCGAKMRGEHDEQTDS